MTTKSKRILKVVVHHKFDDCPDTSWLGAYGNTAKSDYAIDRAHLEDCASVREDIRKAKETLEHAQQTIGDFHNAVLAQYNGTLANEKLDTERDDLDTAYDTVGELIEEIDACDCGERGDMRRHEFRYFNACVENYKGESPADIRKYVRQDYERMESLNRGNWCFIGIKVEAEVQAGELMQELSSGGVWGIESDAKDYFPEVEREELAQLRKELTAYGFSTRAISAAFKNVEHKEE